MKKHSRIISANMKILMIFVLGILLGIKFSPVASAQEDLKPFVAVEEMPTYPGGNAALAKFIGKNVRYPERAKEKGIQGKVTVKFCITAQGGVAMITVLKGVDPELDNEAVRIIKMLAAFNPGKKDGVPVPVWYLVPITFNLEQQ
jgi:periplasmic protein TonB